MATTPASTPGSPLPVAPGRPEPAASLPPGSTSASGAGFHLPSYLLGLITALLLSGAAFFFWPRAAPAAIELQPPPTPPAAVVSPAVGPAVVPAETALGQAAQEEEAVSPLVVFVSGAVAQPGLYTLAPNARIGDAIAAAGGLLAGVDPALLNQAQPLVDGAQLHIPIPAATPVATPVATPIASPVAQPASAPATTALASEPAGALLGADEAPLQAEMQAEMQAAVQAAVAATLSAAPAPAPEATRAPADVEPPAGLSLGQPLALPTPTAGAAALQDATASRAAQIDLAGAGALINVNTATGPELESLPGIGPAKAQAIIANRPYATVEELDRVPGIGPATLEQIRPLVTTE